MKKLSLFLALMVVTLSAWAATTFEVGNLAYEVVTTASSSTPGVVTCTGLSTAGKSGTSLSLTIPYYVSDGTYRYYVTAIGESAFKDVTNVNYVTIAYGVQDIKAQAFYGCTSLVTVNIPSSVTYMRSRCFYGCSRLIGVYLAQLTPSRITTYSNCFSTYSSRNLFVPCGADVDAYRNLAFATTDNFPTIKHSSNAYDFYFSSGGKFVVSKQPTSTTQGELTIIGFVKSSSSTNASQGIFKPGATTTVSGFSTSFKTVAVADSAFAGNVDLVQLDLSAITDLTTVGKYAASGCTGLTTVKVPAGVIDTRAFNGCSNLSSLTIDGVTELGRYSLSGCTSLTSVTIPASATTVYTDFCTDNASITQINVNSSNTVFTSYNNSLYNKARTILWRVPEGFTSTALALPAGVTRIGDGAVRNCTNIQQCPMPYGMKTIGSYVFSGCTSLYDVKIPSSVTTLGVYVFQRCTALTHLYVNTNFAPQIYRSTMFSNASTSINLYTQRGLVDAFKNNGWTGYFASYNQNDVVASDYRPGKGLSYTVSSTEPVTINGTTYAGGRVKLVRGATAGSVTGVTNIPASVTINSKAYAVTRIDTLAFHTSNTFSITGCACVDSVMLSAFDSIPITSVELPYVSYIGVEAFDYCTSLTSAKWGSRLKRINHYAFYHVPLTHDIILPVGCEYLGKQPFDGAQSKKMLIPSTVATMFDLTIYNLPKLEGLYLNNPKGGFFLSTNWDFTGVPTSCVLYVPSYTTLSDVWKNHFNTRYAGAFDFARDSDFDSPYVITVTSTDPVTVDGVTYDGTAQYVIPRKFGSFTHFDAANYETDQMLGSGKKYLMTEIGDGAMYKSNYTSCSFKAMKNLTRIGKAAFYGSKLVSADLPDNRIAFGEGAFVDAADLVEIVAPDSRSWEGRFFGGNASNFNLFTSNEIVFNIMNSTILKGYSFDANYTCADRVAPLITATASTYALAVQNALDFSASGVNAYAVSSHSSLRSKVFSEKLTRAAADQGVILTDLTPGNTYKIQRYYGTIDKGTNYLVAAGIETEIYNVTGAYYWDTENLKFVKPTSSYKVPSGQSYLSLPSGGSEYFLDLFPDGAQGGGDGVTGDVNGDGIVDITDVNMVINMVLGKVDKTTAGDIDGSGDIDITDVNSVINIMLGK